MEQMDEVRRGREAEQIMNNPMFKEAISLVKAGIIDAMERSPISDEKTHNKLVISLQALEQITKHIKTVMETGKMAQMQIERETLQQKLKKAAGIR